MFGSLYMQLSTTFRPWWNLSLMRKSVGCCNINRYFSKFNSLSGRYKNNVKQRRFVSEQNDVSHSIQSNVSLAAKLLSGSHFGDQFSAAVQISQNDHIKNLEKVDGLFKQLDELDAVEIRQPIVVNEIRSKFRVSDDISDGSSLVDADDDMSALTTAAPLKDSVQLYGSPDACVPMSDIPCHGCGAKLHCRDTGIPGYIPSQIFLATAKGDLKNIPCQRCHLLKNYNVALDVSVGPNEYGKILSKIKKSSALVMVLVDLLDMPQSLYQHLPALIGHGRPIYIVGNKVDLLPSDSFGYLARTKNYLVETCESFDIKRKDIKHVSLISAKTGYGVEELITKLLADWKLKGDVYIVGCTNAGKSTLFNDLLSSDFCRIAARDIIQRATASVWPGTTLDLLKFPIVNPKPSRLHERTQRLIVQKSEKIEEDKLRKKSLKETGQIQYATLMGHIGQTAPSMTDLDLQRKAAHSTGFIMPSYSYGRVNVKENSSDDAADGSGLHSVVGRDALLKTLSVEREPYDDTKFRYWCYDTPGLINPEQIINMLSPDELSVMLSTEQMRPRVFSLRPNQVLFLSGLARLDCLEVTIAYSFKPNYAFERRTHSGDKFIYCTVLSSINLPINIVESHEADDFYRENIGSKTFGIPIGDSERLLRIPSLIGRELNFEGIGVKENSADIIFSSLGWISVAAPEGAAVRVRAYTPGGRGCSLRTPSLLPHSVTMRGKRIRGTYTYQLGRPRATVFN